MYQLAVVAEDGEIWVGLNVIFIINLESAQVVIVTVVNDGPIPLISLVEQGNLVLARHKHDVTGGGELVVIIEASLKVNWLSVDEIDEVAVGIECRCTEATAEGGFTPVANAGCHRNIASKPYLVFYR